MWERHVKKRSILMKLNVSASIWGTLVELGLQTIWSSPGQRPNLSPWKSYRALGLGPDTPSNAIYTTELQMGSMWLYDWRCCLILVLWSDVEYLHWFFFFSYHVDAKVGWLVLVRTSFDLHIRHYMSIYIMICDTVLRVFYVFNILRFIKCAYSNI